MCRNTLFKRDYFQKLCLGSDSCSAWSYSDTNAPAHKHEDVSKAVAGSDSLYAYAASLSASISLFKTIPETFLLFYLFIFLSFDLIHESRPFQLFYLFIFWFDFLLPLSPLSQTSALLYSKFPSCSWRERRGGHLPVNTGRRRRPFAVVFCLGALCRCQ